MMDRLTRRPLLALAIVAMFACAGDEAEPWSGTMEPLPGGGVLVSNPARGAWAADAGWQLIESLRIGALDGDDAFVFGRVTGLDADDDGNVYVFDGQANELRVFDRHGALLRRLGRRGAGPGEFTGVIGLAAAPDRAVWLVDAGNARYTIVRGDSLAMHRRGISVYHLPWLGGAAFDGSIYDSGVVRDGEAQSEALFRVLADGGLADTVRVPAPVFAAPRIGSITLNLPFAPRPLRAFDRRGFLWTGSTHEYRLVQTDATGDTVRMILRDAAPRPLAAAEQDSVRRVIDEMQEAFGVNPTGAMLPTSAPLIRWFFIDDGGTLWVRRADAEALDVFDADGRFLGAVDPPLAIADHVRPVVRGTQFYAAALDEMGAPMVVRFELRRGEPAVATR